MRKAVIDLGSNSIRIVIFEVGKSGAQRELENIKQMIRLNEYVDKKDVFVKKVCLRRSLS